MATTGTRKSATIKTNAAVKEFMTTLEKVAPQAKLLGKLSGHRAVRMSILERLNEASRAIEMVRQVVVAEEPDMRIKRHKAVKKLERFARAGNLIKADELMDQLGWTRQALSKARKARRVFSVEIKGETYYPAFFVDPQYDRRQLEAVSKALGDLPGTSKLQFMLTPKGSLNSHTPLEALRMGQVASVKIAAEGFMRR